MKLLLIGEIGSGKSYVGELLQREFGVFYHDADVDLPDDMAEAVRAQQPLTDAMRSDFCDRIIARIQTLGAEHAEFCVAQALFKNRHRQRILEAVPDVRLVWVKSTPELTHARLMERTGHIASAYYAEKINPGFEVPVMPHARIDNLGDASALRVQIAKLLQDARG